MDWESFWNLINENLPEIIRWLVTLIISVIALVVALVRTRTKSIINRTNKIDTDLNLDNYEVVIGDENYNLNDLKIKKKGSNHERKKS